MKCSPFGSVNSVTFLSNSLRFCAGSQAAPNHNSKPKPVTLTAFPHSFTSIENSRTYLQPPPERPFRHSLSTASTPQVPALLSLCLPLFHNGLDRKSTRL